MNKRNWIKDAILALTGVNHYSVNEFQILVANTGVDFPSGTHSHEEFEFMMPLFHDVETICNERKAVTKKGMIMPFNSYDKHGLEYAQKINNFLCFLSTKDYLNNLSCEVFSASTPIVFKNINFKPSNNLNYLIGILIDECNSRHQGYETMRQNLSKLILIEIIRCSENNVITNSQQKKVHAPILRAVKYLEEHYNLPFDLKETAKVSKLSKYYFLKMFYNAVGMTPKSYLIKIKIEKAKDLLLQSDKSISGLAYELGFSSQSHFCMTFKKHCKITPMQFRKGAY